MSGRRKRCRECGDRLIPKYDRGRTRCICCRAAQNLAVWRRRQTARTSIIQLREIHAKASTAVIGARGISVKHHPDRGRRVAVVYEQLLRERGVLWGGVNEPPPGWTPEEDRREELLALSEHLAMRRVGM